MTYINPCLIMGMINFSKRCKDTGICALILPDLPFEEQGELKSFQINTA